MSTKPATPARTYGYYRVEILAALANAVVLFLVSFYILYEAYQRFREPPAVASVPMLGVAVVGLVVNIVGIALLRRGAQESLNVQGAFLEVVSDLLSSVGVLVAGGIMWATGWWYADPMFSVVIGLFIVPRTWKLMNQALNVLLEASPRLAPGVLGRARRVRSRPGCSRGDGPVGHPDPHLLTIPLARRISMAEVERTLLGVAGVASVHDLHIWTITSGVDALSAHVVLGDGVESQAAVTVVERLAAVLKNKFKIAELTTAATLWSTASVGLAVGYGMYLLGILASLIVFGLLAAHHLPGWLRLKQSENHRT